MKRLPLLALSLTIKGTIEMLVEQQEGSKNMVRVHRAAQLLRQLQMPLWSPSWHTCANACCC